MATMNVSLPDSLREFIEEQVSERGFGLSSEFVRELVRRERDRTHLRNLLVEGAGAGDGSDLDDGYFARLRERVHDTSSDAA